MYHPKCLRNSTTVLRVSPCSSTARRACSSATANRSAASGDGQRVTTRQQRPGFAEQPRIAERSPADHDAGAAGVGVHPEGVGGGIDVAVADDRNVERLNHGGDLVPVGAAAEHLRPGPGVQGEGAGAGILHAARDADRIAQLLRPAAPRLGRDREVGRGNARPDDPLHLRHVAQAAGPAVPLHHLLDGATEVDVDEIRPVMRGDERRGLGHGVDVGAVDLDADRPLDFVELAAFQRPADAAANGLGVEELGQHHVGSHPPGDAAERRFRNPRHGGKKERHGRADGIGPGGHAGNVERWRVERYAVRG